MPISGVDLVPLRLQTLRRPWRPSAPLWYHSRVCHQCWPHCWRKGGSASSTSGPRKRPHPVQPPAHHMNFPEESGGERVCPLPHIHALLHVFTSSHVSHAKPYFLLFHTSRGRCSVRGTSSESTETTRRCSLPCILPPMSHDKPLPRITVPAARPMRGKEFSSGVSFAECEAGWADS